MASQEQHTAAARSCALSLVTCDICAEVFTCPKVLPCQHTFCLDCLRKFCESCNQQRIYRVSNFPCPSCRKLIHLPAGGIESLPNDFRVAQICEVIEKLKEKDDSVKREGTCGICTKETAAEFCLQCSRKLCCHCLEKHNSNPALQPHCTLAVGGVGDCEDLQCKEHREEMKYYCGDCEYGVCVVCSLTQHNKHSLQDISTALVQQRHVLQERVEQLRERMEECEDRAQALAAEKKEQATASEECRRTVQEQAQKAMQDIEEWKKEKLQGIERKQEEFTKSVVEEERRLESRVEEMTQLHDTASRGSDPSNTVHLLTHFADIKRRLDVVLEEKVLSAPPASHFPVDARLPQEEEGKETEETTIDENGKTFSEVDGNIAQNAKEDDKNVQNDAGYAAENVKECAENEDNVQKTADNVKENVKAHEKFNPKNAEIVKENSANVQKDADNAKELVKEHAENMEGHAEVDGKTAEIVKKNTENVQKDADNAKEHLKEHAENMEGHEEVDGKTAEIVKKNTENVQKDADNAKEHLKEHAENMEGHAEVDGKTAEIVKKNTENDKSMTIKLTNGQMSVDADKENSDQKKEEEKRKRITKEERKIRVVSWADQSRVPLGRPVACHVDTDSEEDDDVFQAEENAKVSADLQWEVKDFQSAKGVAIYPDLSIAALDHTATGNKGRKFNSQGQQILSLSEDVMKPWSAVVNSNGQLAVTDHGDASIKILDAEMSLSRVWRRLFSQPCGIGVMSGGEYVVTDAGNRGHRVSILLESGLRVRNFAPKGKDGGHLLSPYFVAVDQHDRIIISDFENHDIRIFDRLGQQLTAFAWRGSDGQAMEPRGVAVTSNNEIMIADGKDQHSGVSLFSADGRFIQRVVDTHGAPWGVGVRDKTIAVATDQGLEVYALG